MHTTINIHPADLPKVTKTLDRLTRKANTHHVDFAYHVGDQTTVRIKVAGIPQLAPAIPVTVTTDTIGANGWTLLARIAHEKEANIVTLLDKTAKLDPAWRTMTAHCDHCNTTRHRKDTFIVQHPTNGRKQVGRNCLKEYTGIDPVAALLWAEVRNLPDIEEGDEWDAFTFNTALQAATFPLEPVLAYAVALYHAEGFTPADAKESNKNALLDPLNRTTPITDTDRQEAADIIAWLNGLDWENLDEFDANCKAIAKNGTVQARHMGYVAYLPVAYQRTQERDEQARRERERRASQSRHVGTIGERVTVEDATVRLVTAFEGAYGVTFLYEFTDPAGDVFAWFTSKHLDVQDGSKVRVAGAVKKHDVYHDLKRTVLTRCKINA